MPLLSILDENRGNITVTFSCLVNVVNGLKFIVVVVFFFLLCQKHRRALNFRLDFLIKKGKVSVFFMIYLTQNV